jgi:hypothetical protein
MELAFKLPSHVESLSTKVQAWANEQGLETKPIGLQKKYPGSEHWHFRREKLGTIELTIIANEGRGWFTMRRGRAAGWDQKAVQKLVKSLLGALGI